MKYECIKHRLATIGKTQTDFANAIGITQQKLNVTLNHPELREFQTSEILRAAEFLGYDTESFLRYVADGKTPPRLADDSFSTSGRTAISPETMVDIIDALDTFLAQNNLTMDPTQRKRLIEHFCRENCHTAEHIVSTLSALLAVNGDLFTKEK